MDNAEQTRVLQQAKNEIQRLRSQNEKQSLRLGVYDQMMAVFNAEPPRYGMSHTPDVCSDLDLIINDLAPKKSE